VEHTFEDLLESGEDVPEPLNKRRYSGKLVVRLPKYLHRQLAIEAAEEGVSPNQLVSTNSQQTRAEVRWESRISILNPRRGHKHESNDPLETLTALRELE
jgi:hypothetical protein